MRVYFFASVTGRKKYDDNYRSIVGALEKNSCLVDSEHVFTSTRASLLNQTLKERISDHNKLQALMKGADLAVAEVSFPSTSIGYEIARALEWNKPLLVLHLEGTDSPTILRGRISDRLIIESYTLLNLDSVIEGAIDFFKRVEDTRFTLLLPEKIIRYLDWISKFKKKPRSVFIRETLLEKLAEDREFLENEKGTTKTSLLTEKLKMIRSQRKPLRKLNHKSGVFRE